MKHQLSFTTLRPRTRITFFDLFGEGQKVISGSAPDKESILTLT